MNSWPPRNWINCRRGIGRNYARNLYQWCTVARSLYQSTLSYFCFPVAFLFAKLLAFIRACINYQKIPIRWTIHEEVRFVYTHNTWVRVLHVWIINLQTSQSECRISYMHYFELSTLCSLIQSAITDKQWTKNNYLWSTTLLEMIVLKQSSCWHYHFSRNKWVFLFSCSWNINKVSFSGLFTGKLCVKSVKILLLL